VAVLHRCYRGVWVCVSQKAGRWRTAGAAQQVVRGSAMVVLLCTKVACLLHLQPQAAGEDTPLDS
jgi:hypothetical protein